MFVIKKSNIFKNEEEGEEELLTILVVDNIDNNNDINKDITIPGIGQSL